MSSLGNLAALHDQMLDRQFSDKNMIFEKIKEGEMQLGVPVERRVEQGIQKSMGS